MHTDKFLPSKVLHAWFSKLDAPPSDSQIAAFVEQDLNGCTELKAAEEAIAKWTRRSFLSRFPKKANPAHAERRKKARSKSGTLQFAASGRSNMHGAVRHVAQQAPSSSNRPSHIDPKFKTPCKKCGTWSHYSNYTI